MGFFSKLFDDVLGFDPNGGGVYSAVRDVVGNKIGDDILGMDPNGGGAIGAYNALGPLALTAGAGYLAAPYVSGLMGGGAAAGSAGSAATGSLGGLAGDTAFGSFSLPGAGAGALDLSGAFTGLDPSTMSVLGDFTLSGGGGGAASSLLSQLASGVSSTSDFLKQYGSPISQLMNIGSGIYGMKLAGDARAASDPFAKYRPGYGAALQQLEANPNSIQTRPGFQAGVETINRNMAGGGYLGSGNQAAALMRYSGDFYNQEASRLAQLAGAGQSPGAGQFGAADLASKSLGSIGYGVAPSTQPNYNSNQLLQLALSQLMRP